jgi:hypothetical protein
MPKPFLVYLTSATGPPNFVVNFQHVGDIHVSFDSPDPVKESTCQPRPSSVEVKSSDLRSAGVIVIED